MHCTKFVLGWPWPTSDHVFPKEKGRFALQNGVETYPPVLACSPNDMSIKELKNAIDKAGLKDKSKGFSEKREFIDLLMAHRSK